MVQYGAKVGEPKEKYKIELCDGYVRIEAPPASGQTPDDASSRSGKSSR